MSPRSADRRCTQESAADRLGRHRQRRVLATFPASRATDKEAKEQNEETRGNGRRCPSRHTQFRCPVVRDRPTPGHELRWHVVMSAGALYGLAGKTVTEQALTFADNVTEAAGTGLGGLAGWAVEVITAWGPLGVGVLVAAENLFPPIPSEIILPVAGYVAGAGRMSVWVAWLAATFGSVLGAVVLYWVGALAGQQRLRSFADRVPLLRASDIDKGAQWFSRYGPMAVLTGRCVPVVRSVVSIPAGVARMPMRVFLPYTAIGSGVPNAALVGAGYQLGEHWQQVEKYAGPLNTIILVAIGAWLLFWITSRALSATSTHEEPSSESDRVEQGRTS